jgi:hypothetical protein
VIANGGLDRVRRLERLLDEVRNSLADGASFVAHARIGKNGHQFWPETLDEVQRFWEELPIGHRWNHQLRRSDREFLNWDHSRLGDGVRAQDVLPLLLERFCMPLFAGYGGAIEAFIGTAFGPNFSPHQPWDRDFIARVHERDEELLQQRKITPTRMFAVMSRDAEPVQHHARDLAPEDCVRVNAG